jgi:hypothetical protein
MKKVAGSSSSGNSHPLKGSSRSISTLKLNNTFWAINPQATMIAAQTPVATSNLRFLTVFIFSSRIMPTPRSTTNRAAANNAAPIAEVFSKNDA